MRVRWECAAVLARCAPFSCGFAAAADLGHLECDVLERSQRALWRLIHATTKPSSSLNTYILFQIFLDPLQCNVKHFRVREKFWDTDPTPGAHPPNVPILADRRQPRHRKTVYSSLNTYLIPDFLEPLQCNVKNFHVREK